MAEQLAERGHEVWVLTSDHRTVVQDKKPEEQIFRRLKVHMTFNSALAPAATFFLRRRELVLENLRQLEIVLDDVCPEVVFIWNLQELPREIAVACEERPGLVVAYWLAGYSPADPDEFWRYWEHVPNNRALRLLKYPVRGLALRIMENEGKPIRPKMAHVAVVSEFMLQKGLREGTLPAHSQVIYNGVELKRFYHQIQPRKHKRTRILQAGRINADKGVHTTLRAASYLVSAGKGDRFEILIAGNGPVDYVAELEAYVADHSLQNNISFLDWIPRDDMPTVMANHDVLLLPSIIDEAFSRAVLEGMAAGLAVVASRTGGTGELIKHQINGLTFQAGDSADLASQLQLLIDDDGTRQQLARKGQQKVIEEFSMDTMVDNVESFLLGTFN